MSDTTFVSGTVIAASWLNDVNDVAYGVDAQSVYLTAFGADPTGVTASDTEIAAAIATGKHVIINGLFKITSPVSPTQAGMSGFSPDISGFICSSTHGIQIASTAGFDRPSCILEKFSVNSTGNTCDDKYAFYIPGVANAAAVVYNSGVTIRDIEIGRTGRMGGGFYLKDLFRCNIEDIGLTDVSTMMAVIGSVVQLKVSNVTSNNDSAAATLSKYGIYTAGATYASGTLTPESCRFIDCSYIRGAYGVNHTAGLNMEFVNLDSETTTYGLYINAACAVTGGIVVPQSTASGFVGLYRGVAPGDPDDGVVIDSLDINALNTPAGTNYAVQMGDGVSPVYGFVLKNFRIRGNANSWTKGIYGRDMRDCTIQDGFIRTSSISGNDVEITGRRLFISRNRNPSGTFVISDGGETTAYGEITYNQLSALTFTPTVSSNWDMRQNETLKRLNRGAVSIADGATITHGLSSTPTNIFVTTTTSGEFASVTATSSTTFTVAIKKHDNTAGTTSTVFWEASY